MDKGDTDTAGKDKGGLDPCKDKSTQGRDKGRTDPFKAYPTGYMAS